MKPPARPATDNELRGRLNKEKTMAADGAHYENPGPTKNIRGIEPNTARDKGKPNEKQTGSGDEHGSMVHTPDHVQGHSFQTRSR